MAYEILIPPEEENQYLALDTRYQLSGQNLETGKSEEIFRLINIFKEKQ